MQISRALIAASLCVTALGAVAQRPMTTADLARELSRKPAANAEKATTASASEERLIPDLKWGANDEWKLQTGGSTRLRLERRLNYDLTRSTDDDDNHALLRSHLQFDLLYRDLVRAYLDVMDSRAFDQADGVDYLATARAGVHQLFFDFKGGESSPFTLRLGRQEMRLGSRVLVNSSRWGNTANTWDGGRLIYKRPDSEWTAFVMQPNTYRREIGDRVTSGRAQNVDDQVFYGVYGTMKARKNLDIDIYGLGLRDSDKNRTFPITTRDENGNFGTQERYTLGVRAKGEFGEKPGVGKFQYELEGAGQFGHLAEDDIRAGALLASLTYAWEHRMKPTLGVEAMVASGDNQRGDGETNTFNNLYGRSEQFMGRMELARFQNLRQVALKGSLQPTEKLTLESGLHLFWLDSKSDTWFRNQGGNIAADPTGNSGRELGKEINAVATYQLTKRAELMGGAAHFFGGDFPDNRGRDSGASYLFLQWRYSF